VPDEREERLQQSGGTADSDHHPEIDWIAAERSPEFRELIRKRRLFVLPATIFFLSWYFGFIILAGWAYIRKADRDFDPLASKATETALEAGRRRGADAPVDPGAGREVTPS
jgi:hypothetical protein